jgi:hypothetical protein
MAGPSFSSYFSMHHPGRPALITSQNKEALFSVAQGVFLVLWQLNAGRIPRTSLQNGLNGFFLFLFGEAFDRHKSCNRSREELGKRAIEKNESSGKTRWWRFLKCRKTRA